MFGLDQNGGYLLAAFGISAVVLGGYGLYLRARLISLRGRLGAAAAPTGAERDQSARKVRPAAAMVSSAQSASSANGPNAA